MKEIVCLTFNRELDGRWRWTAYNEQGLRELEQDKCEDLPHALECSIQALAEPGPEPQLQAIGVRGKSAAQPPARRKKRKRA